MLYVLTFISFHFILLHCRRRRRFKPSIYDWRQNYSTDWLVDTSRICRRRRRGSFLTAIATRLISKISRRWYPRISDPVGSSSEKGGKAPPLTKSCIHHWLSLKWFCHIITQSTYSSCLHRLLPPPRDQSLISRLRPLARDGTRSGFLTRDPTRPDPVSSLNDVKFRNVVTSQGQSVRK